MSIPEGFLESLLKSAWKEIWPINLGYVYETFGLIQKICFLGKVSPMISKLMKGVEAKH